MFESQSQVYVDDEKLKCIFKFSKYAYRFTKSIGTLEIEHKNTFNKFLYYTCVKQRQNINCTFVHFNIPKTKTCHQ